MEHRRGSGPVLQLPGRDYSRIKSPFSTRSGKRTGALFQALVPIGGQTGDFVRPSRSAAAQRLQMRADPNFARLEQILQPALAQGLVSIKG